MAKISTADFKYYQSKIKKDKDFHQEEFIERIDPDLIDRYFEGAPDKMNDRNVYGTTDNYIDRVSLNSIFPATSTLVAQFYPQNPTFTCSPKRAGDEMRAKVSQSAMNYYFDQMGAENENQMAIISAWMYGFGVTKQGWRTVFKRNDAASTTPSQKEGGLISKIFTGTPSMEEIASREYIAEEGPFLEYRNPKNIYLDSEQPLGKGRFVHERIPKSIYEIRTSDLYSPSSDFINRYRKKNERETVIDLIESWIWMPDGLYVLVTTDGWNEPLRWDKTPYFSEGFPYRVLTLTQQINRIYPVSHMKVAQRLQKFLDYTLTLQKEHIEKHKNITVFDGDAFEKDDRARIKKNEIGLNIFTKNGRPASTAAAHVGGNTIPTELFKLEDILRSNIKEILTVIGARQSGDSEMQTATQEKIADFGNQLRAMGMQSQIKDFLKGQGRKLLQNLKQFGTAPAIMKVTGLDLVNPETGVPITEEWLEFGTMQNPEMLKDIIPAELDIDVDVYNAQDRSAPVMRKQMNDFVQGVVMPLAPVLAQQGKMFNAYAFIKKMAETFETVGNADEFFENVPIPQGPGPEEGGQGGAPGGDMGGGGGPRPIEGEPDADALMQGAEGIGGIGL